MADGQEVNVADTLMPWEVEHVAGPKKETLLGAWDSAKEDPDDAEDEDLDDEDADDPVLPESDDDDEEDDEPEESDEDDEDEESEEDEEDEDESEEEELFEVPGPDGTVEKLTKEDLVKGHLRQADYTRKTQEVAKVRDEVNTKREEYLGRLERVDAILNALVPAEEPDWGKLREENPGEYAAQREEWRNHMSKMEAVQAEITRVSEESLEEQKARFQEYAEAENKRLLEVIPEWQDPGARTQAQQRLYKFAKERYGFSDEELGTLIDHRLVRLVKDAADGIEVSTKGKKKVEEAVKNKAKKRKTLKPGSSKARTTGEKTKARKASRAAFNKLAKSGSGEDALSVFDFLLED